MKKFLRKFAIRFHNVEKYPKFLLSVMALIIVVSAFPAFLMGQSELRRAWDFSFILCAVNALSILFAKELFRFRMSFFLQNAKDAEPSDLQYDRWYIAWTVAVILVLILLLNPSSLS